MAGSGYLFRARHWGGRTESGCGTHHGGWRGRRTQCELDGRRFRPISRFHSLSYPDIDWYRSCDPPFLPEPKLHQPALSNNGFTVLAGDERLLTRAVIPDSETPLLFPGHYHAGAAAGREYNRQARYPSIFTPVYPPAIPARRLFVMPDAYNPATAADTTHPAPSNASERGSLSSTT